MKTILDKMRCIIFEIHFFEFLIFASNLWHDHFNIKE